MVRAFDPLNTSGFEVPPVTPVIAGIASGPNALQGSAIAALIWVPYDLLLSLDREIWSVWKSPWGPTKCLYIFLRYNSIFALSFYFMETRAWYNTVSGDVNSTIPLGSCFICALFALLHVVRQSPREIFQYSLTRTFNKLTASRTEILCVLVGEALILLRINALYGWERKWIAFTVFLFISESIVGISTTVITLLGGSKGLSGSTEDANCHADANNVPDVNIGMWCTSLAVTCIYFTMIFRKTYLLAAENSKSMRQILWSPDLFPTIQLCLKDACVYFLVVFVVLLMNLVLITAHRGYAQVGTPWLIATYTVASTRIFLNLKDLTRRANQYNSATWSEFERASVLNLQLP
ncbi:hypothetical protein C8R44DRAFT_975230 [Mycena epipterygia]|nr:hypothetical protein C8R44DRAFT_975230 [Mycena epipterygia]